jgi:hypothetical protein
MGIGVILFCIGTFLLINGSSKYIHTVKVVRQNLKDDEVLYQQYITEEANTSYAELIGMLFNQLDYDIEIDGLIIDKSTHTQDKIASYGIEKVDYKKEYLYDYNGKIYKIVFTRN